MFHRLPVVWFWICIGTGLLGAIGSRMPLLSNAEESLGLHLLYMLRGPEQTKADVVIVAIDRQSAKALNLPAAPHKWPRTLHARLLERLTARQAAVIVFDLIFHEPQETVNDKTFATAMHNAGNVILTQTIDRQAMPLSDRKGVPATRLNIERMVSAIPVLADAAIGQAPFPLPKVPIKLSQYWCFRSGSGDVPTLPVAAFHAFDGEAFNGFIQLLRKADPALMASFPDPRDGKYSLRHVIRTIRPLHALFEKDATLAPRMIEALDRHPPQQMAGHTIRRIRSLISLYGHGNSRYLNLYGPSGTIPTISYHRFVTETHTSENSGKLPPLKGKAVFVGQTESAWFKANDGFYTAFTQKSGVDISGVEIAATAFANLLEDKAVYPLEPNISFAFFLGWGILSAFIALHFSTSACAAGLLLLNGIYIAVAHIQFKSGGIWFPLVVPILIQTPAAFIVGLAWKYRNANTERQNIRKAFGHYLPDEVVDRLSANIKELRAGGQVLYSICLFTDAQNYTTLSETMDPESLTQLMNTYYEAVFKPVKANGGLVLQVIGDSVLALWTAPEVKSELKKAACRAAIEITASVNRFNAQAVPYLLPTRIGIHAGEILLGNIGAMDHFEYRPVGDIVNTASRLEGLNKFLGTRMLASQEAFAPDNGFSARPVGRFVFKGKSHPVQVHELLPQDKLSPELQTAVARIFASGLNAFEHQRWDQADDFFNRVLQIDDTDGPSRFYLRLCREYRQRPPGSEWDGTVHLKQK